MNRGRKRVFSDEERRLRRNAYYRKYRARIKQEDPVRWAKIEQKHCAYMKEVYAKDPERIKAKVRAYRHSLPDSWYVSTLASQNGVCAICKLPQNKYCLDHDHTCCPGDRSCGKCARGLVCQPCNKMLAFAKDNPTTLMQGAIYLERVIT